VKKKLPFVQGKRRNILADVDMFLKKYQCSPKKLHGIVVFIGPGQFSYLRTGVVIANTLGYTLGIPVVGISAVDAVTPEIFFQNGLKKLSKTKKRRLIVPEYGSEPNITKGKKMG